MLSIKTTFAAAILAAVMAGSGPSMALASGGPGVLYDAGQGTLPELQGWSYFFFPPFSVVDRSVAGGLLSFETLSNGIQAGFARTDQTLDSTAGFRIGLTAQIISETHASNDRAGFSLIVLDSAHRGVELGFWNDSVFALNAPTPASPGLFTHAESSTPGFSPDAAFQSYSLQLHNDAYTLSAAGATILSGAMRDYSASIVPVYSTPNFIFFGDDTSSARAAVHIGMITVSAVPEPGMAALMLAGLCLVAAAARRSRASC